MLSRYKKVSQQQLSETVRNYMYAIIKTGGKQYRVSEGDLLKVELLGDVKVGDKVTLSEVLAVGEGKELKVGTPTVEGASVTASVVSEGRADKVRIFQSRKRKHSKKSAGHRQYYVELKIETIAA